MINTILLGSFLAVTTTAFPFVNGTQVPACGKLAANGGGPIPGNGIPGLYMNSGGPLRQIARTAATPKGYTASFIDSIGATEMPGYMTYYILKNSSYEPAECAAMCDAQEGCQAFNIYYARDPMYEQEEGCMNPPAVTNIKCALYSQAVSPKTATNVVQEATDAEGRTLFTKVNVGSNGYNKVSALSNFKQIDIPDTMAINAPENYITYTRNATARVANPETCAKQCVALTAEGTNCAFFNSYHRFDSKDGGHYDGTYCAFYTSVAGAANAVNKGLGTNKVFDSTAWALYDWGLYAAKI